VSVLRQRLPFPDPNGRLQVVECADDATGVRVFAVYEGGLILRLYATREQSFVCMQRMLAERAMADSGSDSAA